MSRFSPTLRRELAPPSVLLVRGSGRPAPKPGRVKRAISVASSALAALVLGLLRVELLALTFLFGFGTLLLDVTHPSQGAETITAANAATFYGKADLGSGEAIEFSITPTGASSGYVGGNFHALFADNSQHGGIWLNDTKLEIYTAPGDVAACSIAMTWSASQTITLKFWNDAGTRKVTISGATTGNGTTTLSQNGPYFDSTQDLGVGSLPGSSAFRFAGAISDVTDGVNNQQFERTASSSAAADIATVAKKTHERTATIATAAAIAIVAVQTRERSASSSAAADIATIARHSYNRAATSSVAGDILTITRKTCNRSASSSAAAAIDVLAQDAISRTAASSAAADVAVVAHTTRNRSTAGSSAAAAIVTIATKTSKRSASSSAAAAIAVVATVTSDDAFGIGVSSSAIDTFGHGTATCSAPGGYLPGGGPTDADGRTPTAVETRATGSAIYVAVGRPNAATESASDNKSGNTYTQRAEGAYEPAGAAAWETAIFTALNVNGGPNHIVSVPGIVGDELTIFWTEIIRGFYFAGYTTALHAAGATQIITLPQTEGPTWAILDWFGDGPTITPEGALLTVSAPGDWTVVDARLTNHTDGWIQGKRWKKFFATGIPASTTVTTTPGRSEGCRLWAAAFQEAPQIERSASSSAAADIAVVARRTCNRTAASAAAAGIAVVVHKASYRSAASATAFDIATVAHKTMARAAPSSQAAQIDTVPRRLMQRSAAIVTPADILVATRHTLNRSASSSAAAGIDVLADQSGTLNRSAASEAAAAIAVSPTATRQRSAISEAAAEIAVSPVRTGHSIERTASSSAAFDIAVVPTKTSHAPPAPVSRLVLGYADPDPSTV